MVIVERGIIANGGIALDKPLELPEGSQVIVRIETASPETASQPDESVIRSLRAAFPFVGQWADRGDIPDSAEHIGQERAKWQQRPFRQD
jgi:hypothetical protein